MGSISMFERYGFARRPGAPFAASLFALMVACPSFVWAQQDNAPQADGAPQETSPLKRPVVSSTKPTSPNATVNLVNLLVQQGVLKEDQAQALIKQAEDEAYVSRQAAKDATLKAGDAAKAADAAAAAAAPPGSKHVVYVPEVVKKQLRDEIKKEVMAEAKADNWASPGLYPEWASRVTVYGDLRGREQEEFFPKGGYNAKGGTINFNSINSGSPYDISGLNLYGPPAYNNSQNASVFGLRARLGVTADLPNSFTAGFRIGTGDSASPVSTSQTLGGQNGEFSKYSLWVDRAFLKYQPNQDFALTGGRFDNPFFAATDLVWFRDLGFDGAAVQAQHEFRPGFTPFVVAGAFPIFNTNLNAGTTQGSSKELGTTVPSEDKYLFGGQVGFKWKPFPNYELTAGVSYYDFTNVRGHLSAPCDVTVTTFCSTDGLRPLFAQKGNTYMYLRDIVAPAGNTGGAFAEPEYFGLASDFRPVDVSARLDLSHFDPIHVIFDGEYVVNTGFDRGAVSALAVNNLAGTSNGSIGPYNGGNQGWMARMTVGDTKLARFGDWNASLGYKYLESDAVMDAFADSDFGLGGTNLKGYIVGGNFAFSSNVWTTVRWLSAENIAGSPYAVDVLQVDLNAKF
jgi:hypothetical protein